MTYGSRGLGSGLRRGSRLRSGSLNRLGLLHGDDGGGSSGLGHY